MPTAKVSATLDRDVLREIKKRVGARRVSSFLSQAAREKLQRVRILAYLDHLDAKHGPIDEAAEAQAARLVSRVLKG